MKDSVLAPTFKEDVQRCKANGREMDALKKIMRIIQAEERLTGRIPMSIEVGNTLIYLAPVKEDVEVDKDSWMISWIEESEDKVQFHRTGPKETIVEYYVRL
ncbi:MAG: hypothetical protein ABEJ65_00520 [bacterium]